MPAEVSACFNYSFGRKIMEEGEGGGFLEHIREGSHLFSFIFPF